MSAAWPPSRARRVLLTHVLMGHDRDATADAVRELAGSVAVVDPGVEILDLSRP